MNTHLNWYSALMSSIHDLDWRHDDVFLLSIPLYHVAGLYTFLGFMNVGATVVLEAVPNPSEIVSLINSYKVTYLIFTGFRNFTYSMDFSAINISEFIAPERIINPRETESVR